jgi:hypothetical protein
MEPMSIALAGAGVLAIERYIRNRDRKKNLQDFLNHYWIICRTRHGKTTYIRTKLIPEFKGSFPSGSLVVFETKDEETINDLLDSIPPEQHEKTLVYAPIDMKKNQLWIGLNLIQKQGDYVSENTLLTNELIACFERAFGDSIKSNSKDIIRNGSLAVLESLSQASLLEVYKMFNDNLNSRDRDKNPFRTAVIDSISNPFLSNYFKTNFLFPSMATMDIYNPIYNKFRTITNDQIAANCLCQLEGINIRELIDDGWNLIFFFPKGELGPELSRVLSSIAFSKVQLAVQSRSTMRRELRYERPIMIVADEFQDYAVNNTSFNEFLNQAAGFGASLVLAHQHINQEGLSDTLIHSILGNVGNIIVGRVGEADAELLEDILSIPGRERREVPTTRGIRVIPSSQPFTKSTLTNMPQLHFIEKLTIDGESRNPRMITIDKPKSLNTGYSRRLRESSLWRCGVPTFEVEESIRRRLNSEDLEYYRR